MSTYVNVRLPHHSATFKPAVLQPQHANPLCPNPLCPNPVCPNLSRCRPSLGGGRILCTRVAPAIITSLQCNVFLFT